MAVILGSDVNEERTKRAHLSPWAEVAWRTIIGAVLVVCAVFLLIYLVLATKRVIIWTLIAGFFAIVLAPSVRRVQRVVGGRRGLATAIVMFSTAVLVFGLIAVFVLPIRSQVVQVVTDLPGTVDGAARGTGPLGHIVTRLNLDQLVRDHREELNTWADNVSGSSINYARGVINGILAFAVGSPRVAAPKKRVLARPRKATTMASPELAVWRLVNTAT